MSAPLPEPQVRAVLRAAATRHPNDFRIQYAAGTRADTTESAIGYLRAAVALRPDNAAAVYQLGFLLYPTRSDEGADYLLRAIELDPDLASAYLTLADAIKIGANPARAIAHFQQEAARHPDRPMPHFGLGMALRDSRPREAAEAFQRAIARDDTFAPAHNYLGYVTNDNNIRIRCYRRAIELDPTFAFPHFNLAGALRRKGDLRGAEAEYREALKHFPQHTFSYMGLAELLAQQNRMDEAAECWLAAIRTNASFSPAYPPLGSYLLRSGKTAEAVVVYQECVARFPAESLGYDGLIIALARQGDHAAAVGVYVTVALRGMPNWPADMQQRLRYNAASSAVLAGSGQGRDAPPEADRAMFRHQALSWLRAELAGWRKLAGSDDAAERKKAADALTYWLGDANLAATRPGPIQVQLPAAERAEWDALWADVKAALAEARRSSTPPEVAPPPREVMR
jgi:tetratricopeptide (TPR) repeat protein